MTTREFYQDLYDKSNYGKSSVDMCPGVRYLPHYIGRLQPTVVDLGCGTGDTVDAIKKTLHMDAVGIDWIDNGKQNIVADITEPLISTLVKYQSLICMDVLEHIPTEKLEAVFRNISVVPNIVLTIHTGSSVFCDEELHLTQKPIEWWVHELVKYMFIDEFYMVQPKRYIVFATSRDIRR